MTDFNTELTREQNATAIATQIKEQIKTVAENKGISVGSTDTPLSVLSNIDDGTIATPTGQLEITENGVKDVTNYASVNVNVPSEEPTLGTKTITANGTYNASDDNLDGYSSVTVNVTSGGSSKFASLVDRSITQVTAEDLSGVTRIGKYAFNECQQLTSIDIPSSVTYIGDYAFQACASLTSITIPSSVTGINNGVFASCFALTSIEIPSGVTSIGTSAFHYCYHLTSITIPSGVTSIGHSAFSSCEALTSIEIPSGVTSIRMYAFSGCTALTEITVLAETPPTIQSNTFHNVPNTAIYYVPDTSVETYKTATNWSALATQIQPLSSKPTT